MKTRIYFLDNLRTFLIFLVVVIHCGIVYEAILENSWIVVDNSKNNAIGLIRMYLDTFVMFTLFYISGFFIPYSIKSKSDWEFIKSKFNRLLLPWIVAVLTMIPAYKAIFLYSRGLHQEEWFSYFHIFQRPGGDPYFFADNPVMNWLWFLPILFSFQLIFLLLQKINYSSIKISMRNAVFGIAITSIVYSLLISILDLSGWHHSAIFHFQRERLLPYFLVFLLGALSYHQGVFNSDVRNKKLYLWSNALLTLSLGVFTVIALNLFFNMADPSRNYYFISETADRGIYYLTLTTSMLSFLYIWIYTFRFYLNKSTNLLKDLASNSYFVYIIHVVVLGIIALPLTQVQLPAFLKFTILTISTFAISNIIVSLYRKSLMKPLSSNLVTTGVLLLAAVLTVLVYTKQANLTIVEGHASSQSQISTAGMGLHEAVLTGNIDVINKHIESGTDLNITDTSTGNNPLHSAAAFGQIDAAILLIKAGSDVNFINNEGSTPLHTAAFFCHTKIVETLLANGADKTIINYNGATALDVVSSSFEEVKGIYEYCDKTYGPLGMNIDYSYLEKTRPVIVELLK